jgi:RHS repeat-associated protein
MGRIGTAVLAFLLISEAALAQHTICDVTCSPDPTTSGYSTTLQAAAQPYNVRGLSTPTGQPAANSNVAPAVSALAGSESYNYAIPILRLRGRNGLDVNLVLYYNSRVWTIDKTNLTATFNANRDWPSYGFRLGYGSMEYDSTNDIYTLTEADGSKRQLALISTNTYQSNDASFIQYYSNFGILRYKNGTNVYYQPIATGSTLYRPYRIQDTNGNYISITYRTDTWATLGQEISTITDTVGRVITFNYDPTIHTLTSIVVGSKTYGFSWNTGYVFRYNFTGLTVQNTAASGSAQTVLSGCTYPNGTSYAFVYGDWGIVTEIDQKSANGTLRSSVSYNYPAYTTAPSDAPTFTQQTVNNGSTSAVWSYASTKTNGVVTSYAITDPLGVATTTNLSSNGLVSSVTNDLRTTSFLWNGAPGSNPTIASVTTTLNDTNQQSQVAYLYDGYANATDVKEYDFGLALTRRTAITYLTSGSYPSYRVLDRPTQVKVYTEVGGEALKSRTDLTYDGSSLTSVTGAPNHDDTNFSSSFTIRGNVTNITRYGDAVTPAGAVSRAFTYDSLGNVLTAQLDCCNTRAFTYDSTAFAFPVQTASGSGPQLTTSATYYPTTFLLNTFTDEAGLTTTFAYDSMDRVTSVRRNADGTVFTTSYDDSSLSPGVTRTTPITATTSSVQVTTFDGLGRATRQQLQDGSGNVVSRVDTAYDAAGRVSTVSNPYKSPETPLYTTYQYDKVNRVTKVIPTDGSSTSNNTSYGYYGNQTTVTDNAGKQRRFYTDGLGRLARVDEPGGAPGTGTVTLSGSDRRRCTRDSGCEYDTGTITITVNGFSKSVTYDQNSTATNLASALAGLVNGDGASPVTASASSGVVTLTSKLSGLATNYPLSASSQTTNPDFTGGSFSPTPSGATLTGGLDSAGTPSLNKPFATFYTYDPMNDLIQVSQGAQTRTYLYNGLGRLSSATTPESGTVSYTYNDAGTVYQRTDARSIVTTYTYDGLNRLTNVGYSDSTPAGTFTFTGARLTSMTDGSGSEAYSYDALGRISQVAKAIDATTYNVGYSYNLASELTALTYPSGRIVNQGYDPVGRLAQIVDGNNTSYLSGLTYNSASLPTGFSYGNGVGASFGYNTRLELASLSYVKGANTLFSLTYGYGTGNNGQIQSITDNVDATKSMTYRYDAWARLAQATAGPTSAPTWQLGFQYDRYGNRTQQNLLAGSGFAPQTPTDPATNHLSSPNVYDASGNLTNDTFHTYAYDAQNRTKTVDATGATYTYFGPLRIKKVVGASTTVYVFSGSKVIAEYANGTLSKEYVYAGSQMLATVAAGGATTYQHPGHLSIRAETDASGNLTRSFGHYPFGESWYETGATNKWQFTSYERDSESTLDYAMFRNYSSRLGRFMSPDPHLGDLAAPQSLNRYAYVANDPTNATDPSGLHDRPVYVPFDPYAGLGGGPGTAIWGNTIFDALFGAPGTYFYIGAGSNVQWGFSIDKWYADERAIEEQEAAKDPRRAPEVEKKCKERVVDAVNEAFGEGTVTENDVVGSFFYNGAWNFNFTVYGQAASDVTQGRSNLTEGGASGPTLHVPSSYFWDPQHVWVPGDNSLKFTAHIDSGNGGSFPAGTIKHFVTDVLGSDSRDPCPSWP